jgi:gas vesicle protein
MKGWIAKAPRIEVRQICSRPKGPPQTFQPASETYGQENLLRPKKAAAPPSEQEKQPSQRKVDELMQLVNEKKVVDMSIGTDTYLADRVSSEFATAVVDELRDVVSMLQQWQNDASASSVAFLQDIYNTDMKASHLDNDVMSTMQAPTIVAKENVNSACGSTSPVAAKFCSTCGKAQCV